MDTDKAQLPTSLEALILESEKPVLVDFYADWCGPCKMVSPSIQRLAAEYKGRILTVKVDTDAKPALAARWNISGIPTIMLFHKGKVLMRLGGALPYAGLKAELDKALASAAP
jgi:thioredoxin 1